MKHMFLLRQAEHALSVTLYTEVQNYNPYCVEGDHQIVWCAWLVLNKPPRSSELICVLEIESINLERENYSVWALKLSCQQKAWIILLHVYTGGPYTILYNLHHLCVYNYMFNPYCFYVWP